MFNTAHLHPLIVHFPIALIMVGFFFEILSVIIKKEEKFFSRASLYLLVLGLISAIAASLSGFFFTAELKGIVGELKEKHEICAYVTIGFALITFMLKKYFTELEWLMRVFYLATVGIVGYTGFLGGTMVFDYMIGL